MTSAEPIQVLGAGLAGMSAGFHLKEGFEIHERLGQAGGHAITSEENGYRFDRTGHLLHLRDAGIRAWVQGLLEGNFINVTRRSKVFSHGVYTRYPYQANTYGLEPQVAFECVYGFIEALEQRDRIPEPATFEEFCLKHFGEGFSRHFMIPYNSKMWGVHPREITAQWCSRFVPLPELRDVIAGAVGLRDKEMGYNAEFLYPPLGIGALSEALGAGLSERIRLRSEPRAVDWRGRRLIFPDREVAYQALISSVPLDTLIKLLKDPPEPIAAAGARLRCNPLWYLDVALDTGCGADIHWAYVPEEKYPFYRVGCYSNFSERMAPPGKAGLYVELSSREPPQLEKLLPEVAQGLIDMQIIRRPEQIAFARARRMDHAYVLFDHNYYSAVTRILQFLAEQRIICCGRYGEWNYSSMEDALISGREAALQARKFIK